MLKGEAGTHVECKPRPGCTDENLEILPLGEVSNEVAAGCLGGDDVLDNRVWIHDESAGGQVILDVRSGLLHIALYIHCEARCFGNGETEV